MKSQLHADLSALRTELTPPEAWSRDFFVTHNSSGGYCYCLHGGMMKVVGATIRKIQEPSLEFGPNVDKTYSVRLFRMRKALMAHIPNPHDLDSFAPIWEFNDASSHDQVLAVIDRAIAGAMP